MSLKATIEEARLAYGALRRMNESVKLPQKPAWRVARLMGKLKPIVTDFEETQLKLFKDAGGEQAGNGVQIPPLERREDEPSSSWEARQKERRETIAKLNDDLRELNKTEVDVDYDAIPLSMFEDKEGTPEDKKMRFSANDFHDLGPFITE